MPYYLKAGGKWNLLAGSGTPVDPPPVGGNSRDLLRPMVDKPGPTNTGPYSTLAGAGPYGLTYNTDRTFAFTEVLPNSTQTVTDSSGKVYTIPVCNITGNGPFIGKRYWGVVKWGANTPKFYCCTFAGPDPTTWPEDVAGNPSLGCTQAYGSGTLGIAEAWDCKWDPSWWMTSYAPARRLALNRYNIGHHGGQIRIYRSEITNVSDGINFIGPSGSYAAALAGEFTMVQSWVHKCLYGNNLYPPNDGQPHCDAFQMNYGKNVTLRGNTLGGVRDKTGYLIWPGGYCSGDDFWNTALQLKQETNAPDRGSAGSAQQIGMVENFLAEGNWCGGGASTINLNSNSGNYAGSWSNSAIRNNKILRRQVGWGELMKPSSDASGAYIPHSAGVLVGAGTTGVAIFRPNVNPSAAYWGALFSGNVYEDDGSPVPLSNGA